MRFCAGSIAGKTALVGAMTALGSCVDRPVLEVTSSGGGTIDAGTYARDAGDGAPKTEPEAGMPNTPDPTPWKSGFRLRAKIKDGGDGAKLLAQWRDPVLRLDCSFAPATDGRMRCLPVDEDLPIITTFFADPDCTKTVAIGPPPEQPYVRIVEQRCGRSDDDPKPIRVVRWGGTAHVDAPYLVRSGVCSPITNGPTFDWYAIADADPVQFVGAAERVYVGRDGVGARILVAEDGSHENSRLLDPGTFRPCEVVSDHVLGGPDLCVPTPFAAAPVLSYFSSESCDEPVAFAEDGCDHAYAGLLLRRDSCKLGVDLAELGPWFPTASTGMFRKFADGICRSDMLFSPMSGYVARGPFPPRSFALADVHSFGTGRLRARLHTTPDGLTVRNAPLMPLRYQLDPDSPTPVLQPPPFEFYDSSLDAKCRIDQVADGTFRCVPSVTVPKLGEYFEDEGCTQPAHLGANDAGCPSTGYVSIPGWLEIGLAVPPPTEIRPIGPVSQKTIYMYAPFPIDPSGPPRGTCIAAPSGPGRVYYSLGAPIPVAQLAQVTDALE
jgi:hypothetical protein